MTTEIWTYGGKRLSTRDTLIDCWIDPDGNSLLYRKLSGFDIGGLYEVDVDRSDGVIVKGQPKWLGKRNAELREELTVRDKLTRQYHSRKRKERAQIDALEEALQPVLSIFNKCRTGTERQVVMGIITDYLYTNYKI